MQLVEQFWTAKPGNIICTMEQFKEKIMQWNTHTFSNIFQRKKRFMVVTIGAKKRLEQYHTKSLKKL